MPTSRCSMRQAFHARNPAQVAGDDARLNQRQRKAAETMQNYLLPRLPGLNGPQMITRYLPAPDASQAGGDWCDAFHLSDGATA